MKFEIGKKYLCRNGEIVTVADINMAFMSTVPHPQYNRDIGTEFRTDYYINGAVARTGESDWDIVSEYIEQNIISNLSNSAMELQMIQKNKDIRGNGDSTDYYKLPNGATQLGDIIKHKKMEHGIGEAFCALYRLNDNGEYKRNLTKAKYYIEQELKWLEKQANQ